MKDTVPNIVSQASETAQSVILEPSKQNNFLVILLSILLFVAIVIAGFFAYQTQNLVKELTILKSVPSSGSTVEPTLIPLPAHTETIDPTANWELYTNTENGYSIRFPNTEYTRLGCIGEELTAEKTGSTNRISPMTMVDCERDGRYNLETKTYPSIQSDPTETKYYNIVKNDVLIGGVLGKLYVYTFTEIEDGPFPKWYAIARVNKNNKTYEVYFGDRYKLDLFNQILSTFKFTN